MRDKKKNRKKGAQKKGGENSPVSPPLDPRLIKREIRGQMAFATILQVIRFLNSTSNSSFSRDSHGYQTHSQSSLWASDSRQCCLSIVIRITSAPEKVTACRYIFVFLKLLRKILPSYMQDRMILFQLSPYFIAS